jgi:hypothetical protein
MPDAIVAVVDGQQAAVGAGTDDDPAVSALAQSRDAGNCAIRFDSTLVQSACTASISSVA